MALFKLIIMKPEIDEVILTCAQITVGFSDLEGGTIPTKEKLEEVTSAFIIIKLSLRKMYLISLN